LLLLLVSVSSATAFSPSAGCSTSPQSVENRCTSFLCLQDGYQGGVMQ